MTAATQTTKVPSADEIAAAARGATLHKALGDERLTAEGFRSAWRRGALDEVLAGDKLAGLGEEHLAALREVHENERPRDQVLGFAIGKLQHRVRDETLRPVREREAEEAKRLEAEARRRYRATPHLSPAAFQDLVAERYGNSCPGCGEKVRGYVLRSGGWNFECAHNPCNYRESMLGHWLEQNFYNKPADA